MFRYTDLAVMRESYFRQIELRSALYACRKKLIKPQNLITDEQLKAMFAAAFMKKQTDLDEAAMKLYVKSGKNIRLMKKLKRLDHQLQKMDFDVYAEVTKLGVNVTGNPTTKHTKNHRVIEVGFKNQSTRIKKEADSLSIVSFGVQATTFYSILHVYRFFASYQKAVSAYYKNFELQTKPESYVQFIKNVDAVRSAYPYYDREQKAKALMMNVDQIQDEEHIMAQASPLFIDQRSGLAYGVNNSVHFDDEPERINKERPRIRQQVLPSDMIGANIRRMGSEENLLLLTPNQINLNVNRNQAMTAQKR